VPLADLEHAVARDKLTGKALTDYFLEEMLADPMIRLVMQADGVDESELRSLYSSRPVGWREDPRDRRKAHGRSTGIPRPMPDLSRSAHARGSGNDGASARPPGPELIAARAGVAGALR
jgi:hypothetical protein